jgi:hypothetical protein
MVLATLLLVLITIVWVPPGLLAVKGLECIATYLLAQQSSLLLSLLLHACNCHFLLHLLMTTTTQLLAWTLCVCASRQAGRQASVTSPSYYVLIVYAL